VNNKLKLVLILGGILALGLSAIAFTANPIAALVRQVRSTTGTELAKPGSTAEDPLTGEEVFVGDSATKVAEAHEQAAREYDALRARSPEEREGAIAAIRRFARDPDLTVEYGATVPNPNTSGQMVEVYTASGFQYWVDPRTDVVRQAFIMSPFGAMESGFLEISTEGLEAQVREFLAQNCICFEDMEDQLEHQIGEKHVEGGPTIQFFRWEVANGEVKAGELVPFIQVGVSSNGVVVSYADFVCSAQ
jgi:hypothetical protein